MNGLIKERCIYCGSDVYYAGTETLIKCGMCGRTLVVAKFENELNRMKQAVEEGEQARKDLAEAEQARQEAEARLQKTLDTLDGIKGGQDVLSRLMQSVTAGQASSADKLEKLQDISALILKGQGDLFEGMGILSEIKGQLEQLGLDQQAQKDFARDFVVWFQSIHESDIARLKDISTKSQALLTSQKELSEKIDRLSRAADTTQKTLDAFHSQWQASQLEEMRRLYHQAENYQCERAYDKAYEMYEQVIIKGSDDTEVLWRMLLCHYCISYQQDGSGKWIPIILNPDLTDPDEMSLRRDLLRSMKNETADYYQNELAKIDRILDKYRFFKEKVRYDIFISVKQSDDGHITIDSDKASDLYYYLTDLGYKVFNSRICKAELAQAGEYEPYIIAALMSARVLIVVGTSADNMNAQWVKNEWSRFQWLIKKEKEKIGKTDRRLLCYLAGQMQPYDIPKALNQGQQAITEGPTTDRQLNSALAFLRPGNTKEGSYHANAAEISETQAPEPLEQVLEQMTVWLLTEDYSRVLEKHTLLKVTLPYMKDPTFHLYALCAQKKVEDIAQLAQFGAELQHEGLFKLAVKYSKGTVLENRLLEMTRPKKTGSLISVCRKWAEDKANAGKLHFNSVSSTSKYVRFTTDTLSRMIPDAVMADSEWGTKNHYFCEIINDAEKSFYMQLSVSYKNASEDLKKVFERIEKYYPSKVTFKKWQGSLPYVGPQMAFSPNMTEQEVYGLLDRQFADLTAFESKLRQALEEKDHRSSEGIIFDTWEEIIDSIDNSTYRNKYKIGDTKELDLGTEGVIGMQLVAFDEDELADGSGKAPTTWLAKQVLNTRHRMNPSLSGKGLIFKEYTKGTGTIGGWYASEMRDYLQSSVKTLMPAALRDRIRTVKKYSPEDPYKRRLTKMDEELWIPSLSEVTNSCYHVYNDLSIERHYEKVYVDDHSRIKFNANRFFKTPSWYFLRDIDTYNIFDSIQEDGKLDTFKTADEEGGVCIGFCL